MSHTTVEIVNVTTRCWHAMHLTCSITSKQQVHAFTARADGNALRNSPHCVAVCADALTCVCMFGFVARPQEVVQVTQAGSSISNAASLATQAREIQVSGSLYSGNGSTDPIVIRSQADCVTTMLVLIDAITVAQRSLFLAIGMFTAAKLVCMHALRFP